MSEMALVSKPLEGVEAMLEALYGKVKMGIITNGFTGLQQRRLENTKTEKYFDIVVISEQIGVAKPDRQVFDYAFSLMDCEDKTRILMVGDTLASDVLGGNNAGIDTIWYNPHHLENKSQAQPTYEVHSYKYLLNCLGKI